MLHERTTPFRTLIDFEHGTVAREIFSDDAIYKLELERIFARTWNFMCHESQIPKPGDYFLNYIGEESVIATRNKKGELQVFLNSCRHRGNAVCRAESGNARSFLCTYHGWTYDLDGKLIGVPGYKNLYHEKLEREKWGLIRAGKVASYRGFVFANMDPDAPDLEEFLGPVGRLALDLAAGRGNLIAVEGVQKYTIGCNWKLAVDNIFDYYHGPISHASAFQSGGATPSSATFDENTHRVVLGEYGHAIGGPRLTEKFWELQAKATAEKALHLHLAEEYRNEPDNVAKIGEVGRDVRGHPNIFPNLWLTTGGTQLCLRLPRGPEKTEIWWFTLHPSEFNEAEREIWLHRANHAFGPAGMLEQDDGENWDQSTRATRGPIARRYPLNYQMSRGLGKVNSPAKGIGFIDSNTNEHGQMWVYQAWAEWMDADNWDALRRDHSSVPADGSFV